MVETSQISPLASRVGLPISRVISAARSSDRSVYRSATRRRILARSSFPLVRQDRKARSERSSTCWTSSSVAVANSLSVWFVAGLTTLYSLTLISLQLAAAAAGPVRRSGLPVCCFMSQYDDKARPVLPWRGRLQRRCRVEPPTHVPLEGRPPPVEYAARSRETPS